MEFDLGWYLYCHKDKKKKYNQTYYKKHRKEILEQKKEYKKRMKNGK